MRGSILTNALWAAAFLACGVFADQTSAAAKSGLLATPRTDRAIDPSDSGAVKACIAEGGMVSRNAAGKPICAFRPVTACTAVPHIAIGCGAVLPPAKSCPVGQHLATAADREQHTHGSTALQVGVTCVANAPANGRAAKELKDAI